MPKYFSDYLEELDYESEVNQDSHEKRVSAIGEAGGKEYAFAKRITPEEGFERAIQIERECGEPLRIKSMIIGMGRTKYFYYRPDDDDWRDTKQLLGDDDFLPEQPAAVLMVIQRMDNQGHWGEWEFECNTKAFLEQNKAVLDELASISFVKKD